MRILCGDYGSFFLSVRSNTPNLNYKLVINEKVSQRIWGTGKLMLSSIMIAVNAEGLGKKQAKSGLTQPDN